jgi:protein-disulfide isomerase
MKRTSPIALAFLLASAVASAPCRAQQPATAAGGDLQKQVDALKTQVGALQKDLDEIKALLAPLRAMQPPKPETIALSLGTRPVRGNLMAKVVLVEFTDYQ